MSQLQSFLGLAGYYQVFIKNHKNTEFTWDREADRAFANPDFNEPFHLYTDACKDAVGAVLCQERDGVMKPIEFMSRRFTSAEYNYGI